MKKTELHLIAWFIVTGFVCFTGGLRCIQCVDQKEGQPCQSDYMKLVNATRGLGHEYLVKNCSEEYNQTFCMIETYYSGGEVKSFMRDCSDGKTFSFTDEVKFPRLLQVKGDNFTTCSYRLTANFHVCLSLCESDFCNAPRAPPPNETCNGTDNATCSARSLVLGFLPGVPLFSHVFVLPLLAFALSLLVVD